MTKKVLERLSESVRGSIETLRWQYDTPDREMVRAEARGYLKALRDMEIISAQERKVLFCYITTPKGKEIVYVIQKYAGGWEYETEFDNQEDAEEELEWLKDACGEYKWRMIMDKRTVIWEGG